MSKVFISGLVGVATLISFQNCAKLKSEEAPATFVLASKTSLSEDNNIVGSEYYTRMSSAPATSNAQLSTSMVPEVYKTKVDVDLKKNEISISKYELSIGGWASRVYEVKTCDLKDHRLFGYFKSEIKKVKICTYVSTIPAEQMDYSRCPLYHPATSQSALADLQFYVHVQGLANLSLSENSSYDYAYDPNCVQSYTTYCNPQNDAGRLEPVLDDILSQIESSDQATCLITYP
jgi:hypothetical protein